MNKIYLFFFLISLNFSVAQDGTIDASFNTNVNAVIDSGTASVIVQQPDGKILVGGGFSISGSIRSIIRLNIDGTIDNSFGIVRLEAWVSSNTFHFGRSLVRSIALQPDGKIIIGGTFSSYNDTITSPCLIRLNSDGSYDNTFNNLGFQFPYTGGVNKVLLQNDKIIIGGRFSKYGDTWCRHIIRLNLDGSLDNTFFSGYLLNYEDSVDTIIQKSDNSLLLSFDAEGGNPNNIYHLDSEGYFQNSFWGFNYGSIRSIIEQFDGKVICGGFFKFQEVFDGAFFDIKGIVRLRNDYNPDLSYSTNIGIDNSGTVVSIMQQPDGKIVLFGNFTQYNGVIVNRIVRLNIDGSIDNSFNSAGVGFGSSMGYYIDGCILKQSDGKILVGGDFTTYNNTPVKGIVRLNNPSVLSNSDFSKSKISLYPNPVNEILNLDLSNIETTENLTIYDVTGKNVLEIKDISNHQIDVSSLEKGVYFIDIKTQNGSFKEKFVKN